MHHRLGRLLCGGLHHGLYARGEQIMKDWEFIGVMLFIFAMGMIAGVIGSHWFLP